MLAGTAAKKPSQANLRRAASTTYYAMFHFLAKTSADLLLGGDGADRGKMAWRQTYRALEHALAKKACKNSAMIGKFPAAIQDFANAFATMQEKRHDADYDPHVRFTKSEVLQDIVLVEKVIKDFSCERKKDRRAFCAAVLFKYRPK